MTQLPRQRCIAGGCITLVRFDFSVNVVCWVESFSFFTQMASVLALREYGSSSDEDSEENKSFDESHLAPIDKEGLANQNLVVAIAAAPDVLPNVTS